MKSERLPFNLFSFGLMVTLILMLGLFLGARRQLAFSPGQLSAKSRPGVRLAGFTNHADFEAECSRCHQPLKALQSDLCLECHSKTHAEIITGQGIHGILEDPQTCFACHPDHRGRDYDPSQPALAQFDHSLTAFSLIWHQLDYHLAPIECQACHDPETNNFQNANQSCADCHAEHDLQFALEHNENYGLDCTACHDGKDSLARFDHASTSFPLLGDHQQVDCAGCHANKSFAEISPACQECHSEPALHRGSFSGDCSACHTAFAWSPASLDQVSFDHGNNTAFSLVKHRQDALGQVIACRACHSGETSPAVAQFSADVQACINCHEQTEPGSMVDHQAQFGPACLNCHDGVDRMSNYDHNHFFELSGRHVEIACEDCHQQQIFAGTPRQCIGCHAEPEIHTGYFGLECQSCHTETSWLPAYLRTHTFPLNHGEDGEVECTVCHPATYVEYTCYGCHEHQAGEIEEEHNEENIPGPELLRCVQCHPTGREDEAFRPDASDEQT